MGNKDGAGHLAKER